MDQPINFQVNKTVARGSVSFIQFWMWYGYTMIILISGVPGISPEIFESAEVDGANRIHMTNNFLMLILPVIASPSMVFFIRQYMLPALSMEIIQAARIDGAESSLFLIKLLCLLW